MHKSRKVAAGQREGEASPLFIRGWIFQARFDSALITALTNKRELAPYTFVVKILSSYALFNKQYASLYWMTRVVSNIH